MIQKPLHQPTMGNDLCAYCGGRGKTSDGDCPTCQGTGIFKQSGPVYSSMGPLLLEVDSRGSAATDLNTYSFCQGCGAYTPTATVHLCPAQREPSGIIGVSQQAFEKSFQDLNSWVFDRLKTYFYGSQNPPTNAKAEFTIRSKSEMLTMMANIDSPLDLATLAMRAYASQSALGREWDR